MSLVYGQTSLASNDLFDTYVYLTYKKMFLDLGRVAQ